MNGLRSLGVLQACYTKVPTSKEIFSHASVERFLSVKDHHKRLFSKRKLYTFIPNSNDITKLSCKVVIQMRKKSDNPCTLADVGSVEVPIDEELLFSAVSLMNTQSRNENISNSISNPYSAIPCYSNKSLNTCLQQLKHASSRMTFAGIYCDFFIICYFKIKNIYLLDLVYKIFFVVITDSYVQHQYIFKI